MTFAVLSADPRVGWLDQLHRREGEGLAVERMTSGHEALLVSCTLACALGFTIGFVGSLPIAGPGYATAALHPLTTAVASVQVLKYSCEGKFNTARGLALGAGVGEGTWAGVAFFGFGSFVLCQIAPTQELTTAVQAASQDSSRPTN